MAGQEPSIRESQPHLTRLEGTTARGEMVVVEWVPRRPTGMEGLKRSAPHQYLHSDTKE